MHDLESLLSTRLILEVLMCQQEFLESIDPSNKSELLGRSAGAISTLKNLHEKMVAPDQVESLKHATTHFNV